MRKGLAQPATAQPWFHREAGGRPPRPRGDGRDAARGTAAVPVGVHPTALQRLRGLVGAAALVVVGGVLLAVGVALAAAVAAFLAAQAFS
jgi:hypothetical protein